MNNEQVLKDFLAGKYPQIFCEKCAMTFLTNVYEFGDNHVLLEKRSLGLEYYCGAIKEMKLKKVPEIYPIGIVDEDDNPATPPSREEIYCGDETEFRFIYVMEKLQHLEEEDIAYFDRCVKDLEWQKEEDRKKIYEGLTKRYNPELAQDIEKLYDYYTKHKNVLAWDLHGDNLMHRITDNEIVILDPYTRNC